ncbi:guanylate kinase [Candidatus Endolissoclinum faulkneri L2]|uniref:Guanylate kinase n=1 Tax=Candidatus Endolissoclinum faulkneri L2 TaxID=1193729 RepID=K7YN02_9PROT|nr:guanylate kinase [Candidatus Endolissoclinum faulkneri]AFX98882.1 guanylate kinase [Candidatus Endolissoclinum faulkneri L2]
MITRRGLMLVLSSPSGAGKTSIARKLMESEYDISMSISVTTRSPRPGEVHGLDYFFISLTEFQVMVSRNDLLEHAKVFGNYYGTPRKAVEATLESGKDILFDIDWQGVQQLEANTTADLVSIFILPPSSSELEGRLLTRAQDSKAVVTQRMANAVNELSHYQKYEYVIINDDIDVSVNNIHMILSAERLKRERSVGLKEFVKILSEEKELSQTV